ncbi:MAG: hypothetical protein J3Q66DRAFT_341837 [Benniella sp.]|nr:MAG: hypothetical protein J3Q66DRAFT_341837 [Benniella sp.]
MPVSVDDPFLLVSFSSTAHPHQHQAVTCTPESKQPKQPQDEKEEEESPSSLLVVAIQGEGVQLFNTSDQKCVLSYSTPPGYSFVGPAQTLLKSPQLRHVYAVIARGTDIPAKEEGKVVWLWKDEVLSSSIVTIADANNAMQEDSVKPSSSARKTVHKFDRKIYQLFASPLLLNNVLLANTDGSISLVTDDLKRVISTDEIHTATAKSSRKEKKNTSTQDQSITMIWATTFNSSESWIPSNILVRNTLVLMTIVESSVGKIIATLSYVNEERRGFFTFGQVEIEHALGLSGLDFDAKMGYLSFMTAAGQLKVYGLKVSQGDHIVMASETLTLPLPGYSVTSNTTAKSAKRTAKTTVGFDPTVQHVDAVALGDNYLAIAGAHRNENKVEQTITIWDVKYGTLQAKHVVPGTFTAENTTCQLVLLPGSVLAMTISTLHSNTIKSEIYLCPFYAEPMSLLGAMGKMAGTAPFLGQKGSLLVQDAHTLATATHLTPSNVSGVVKAKDVLATGSDLERQLRTAQDAERKALELLSSESNAFTVQEFEEIFFDHVEHQIADATKDVMERYGVDADEAKAAVAQEEEKAAQKDFKKQKQRREQETKSTKKMDIDTEPGVEDVHSTQDGSKSKKKKQSQTDKAVGSEKEAKSEKKSKSKTAKSKTDDLSSESSSEDDGDHEDEAIVLSSDEEQDQDVEDEEQEYEIDDEEDTTRTEAYKDALREWRRIEAEAILKYKKQRRLLRAGRKQTPLPDLSHHFVTTVVSRSFGRLPNGQPDMSFWPTKVVEYLIENQLVGNSNPGAGQAGIALNLMERGQWSILELALKKLYDIPELDMIMMLKQVIGLNKKKDWMDVKESAVDSIAPTSMASSVPDTPHLLNLIMAAPRNEVFMQQALKRLSVEELSVVLGILRDWIDLWDERGGIGHQGQQPAKKQLPGGLPGYGLMVDFTTLIMDVHFPSLILSPHLHPILKAIQSSIQRETHAAHQLEQALRGPLGLFDRKHREIMRRKEASMAGPVGSGNSGAGGAGDKRRRRKWEGGEGIPDYAVEIIHL